MLRKFVESNPSISTQRLSSEHSPDPALSGYYIFRGMAHFFKRRIFNNWTSWKRGAKLFQVQRQGMISSLDGTTGG